MAISPIFLRPKSSSGAEKDPPVQLKSEGGDLLATESGEQLTTE